MKTWKKCISLGFLALSSLSTAHSALADFSHCAWPMEFSPEGFGNIVAPDDQARYWLMPFDSKKYDTMTIQGSYPNARYFSYVVYNGDKSGHPISVAGHRYDAIIAPDSGGSSPYLRPSTSNPSIAGSANSYTLCIASSGANPANCPNSIGNISNKTLAWVALRIYVPSADQTLSGQALMGGQPLPKITLSGKKGSDTLDPCPSTRDAPTQPVPATRYYVDKSVNKLNDIRAFLDLFFPNSFDIYTPGDYYEAAEGHLWFAAPKEPPIGLLPNPDNKYIAMQPGPYQRGRIVVIRGKAPSFLDNATGSPRSSSASGAPDMRYWSVCNNNLALPVTVVRCVTDRAAAIQDGYYTIVISDDLIRPDWAQSNVNWLPWGDEQYPKLVFLRNMIPVARNDTNYTTDEVPFPYAIQWVVKGCPSNCAHKDAAIDFVLPYVPTRARFNSAGPYVQQIMGDYYPVAVWCDKSAFLQGGWSACVK